MAITVTLYSFTKRENSTKRPASGGTDYSCVLIDDTSLMNPVFKLEIESNPIGKNYCYVSDFNRYYFITDITSSQNFWYISCKCDVLASFKTEIGTGSHYVLRSASDYDGDISDSFYSAKISAVKSITTPAGNLMSWRESTSPYTPHHSYVLGIVGISTSGDKQVGSLCYYHIDEEYLKDFLTYLMDNIDNWSDLTGEYSAGVQQALLNPMQYIKSCICIPYDPPVSSSSGNNIQFGYYTYSGGANKHFKCLDNWALTRSKGTTVNIPKHPQAETRGNYLNCQPFSEYVFHFGPWGDIPLDPMLMQRNTKLEVGFDIDLTSGDARLIIQGYEHNDDIFFNGNANVGVNINISQISVDGLAQTQVETNSIFSIMGAVGGAVGNPSAGSVIGAAVNVMQAATVGIQDATRLDFPVVSGLGNGGSFIPFQESYGNCYLAYKYVPIVDENLAEIGRPLCQTKQINTLTGFILCQCADAAIPGTSEEASLINQYLNSGFFYE